MANTARRIQVFVMVLRGFAFDFAPKGKSALLEEKACRFLPDF